MNVNCLTDHIRRTVTLRDDEVRFISDRVRPKQLAKREYLLKSGDICHHKTFVVKGCLATIYVDPDGNERVVYFAIKDYWSNDMASFFAQDPARFAMVALENTDVLQISRPDFEAIMDRIPVMEKFFRLKYQNSLIGQQRRMMQSLFEPAEERYKAFCRMFPDLENRIPLKYIASYLGITPQFLSVLRGKVR